MTSYIIYDTSNGRVYSHIELESGTPAVETGQAYIEYSSQDIRREILQRIIWVDHSIPEVLVRTTPGATVDKTTITADGVDKATITNIPAGLQMNVCNIDGSAYASYTTDGTDLEITSDEVDTITVDILGWPYWEQRIQVEAI